MLKFGEGFGFDLSDPFPGNFENPAHLFQGIGGAIHKTIPEANDLPLPLGKGLKQGFDLLAEQGMVGSSIRPMRVKIFDEIRRATLFIISHGSI